MDDPSSLDDEALFLEAPDGRIALTDFGRSYYAPYFGYAGFDIRSVLTREDLSRAERAAFPCLHAYMTQRIKTRSQTLESRALLLVLLDDSDAYERALRQLKTRRLLSVVSGSSGGPPSAT